MIILDSNIFIYLANGSLRDDVLANNTITFASVTKIETLGYYGLSVGEEAQLKRLFDASLQHDLSAGVIRRTIAIRQTRKMGLADAIIAATALEAKCELWTANTKDFVDIEGLQLYNPLAPRTDSE